MLLCSYLLTSCGSGAPCPAPEDDSMEQDVPATREAKLAVTPTGLTALRCPEIARPLLTLVFRWGEGMGVRGDDIWLGRMIMFVFVWTVY